MCRECCAGKAVKATHHPRDKEKIKVLELVHSDLMGKIQPFGYNNHQYIQLIVDDVRVATFGATMGTESDAVFTAKYLIIKAEATAKSKATIIRTDRGKEFTSNQIEDMMRDYQIDHEFTPPYSPESNARVERKNRTIIDMSRTMLEELRILNSMEYEKYKNKWPEAVLCEINVHNRVITKSTHKSMQKKTPFEIVIGKRPNAGHFPIFGRLFTSLSQNSTLMENQTQGRGTAYMLGTSKKVRTEYMYQNCGA